jgi:hypothetical protein
MEKKSFNIEFNDFDFIQFNSILFLSEMPKWTVLTETKIVDFQHRNYLTAIKILKGPVSFGHFSSNWFQVPAWYSQNSLR